MAKGGAKEYPGAQATPLGLETVNGLPSDEVGSAGLNLCHTVNGAGDSCRNTHDVGHIHHDEHRGHAEREVVGDAAKCIGQHAMIGQVALLKLMGFKKVRKQLS